jgi:hypothetical protein
VLRRDHNIRSRGSREGERGKEKEKEKPAQEKHTELPSSMTSKIPYCCVWKKA